jgi:hypothetical protein
MPGTLSPMLRMGCAVPKGHLWLWKLAAMVPLHRRLGDTGATPGFVTAHAARTAKALSLSVAVWAGG